VAAFSGTVDPNGLLTTAHWEYGLDPAYRGPGFSGNIFDQSTSAQVVGSDTSSHAFSASVTNLIPNAVYHVRLVASNSAGTTISQEQTFMTPKAPAPPPPVLGKTVNAAPVGKVYVLVNGKFVALTQAQQLPSGAVVDALKGSINITASTGQKGKTVTGTFGGAVFKLIQAHNGLTTLNLVEGAFSGAPTYATCKAHKATDATASAASSKTLQLLHASAHGKFRTSGRYSAATVRGTQWTIADRCDGTLTQDITDSVAVTDFVHHKTVILHAGQRYLATAPRSVRHGPLA
jgi:hypothetical protein